MQKWIPQRLINLLNQALSSSKNKAQRECKTFLRKNQHLTRRFHRCSQILRVRSFKRKWIQKVLFLQVKRKFLFWHRKPWDGATADRKCSTPDGSRKTEPENVHLWSLVRKIFRLFLTKVTHNSEWGRRKKETTKLFRQKATCQLSCTSFKSEVWGVGDQFCSLSPNWPKPCSKCGGQHHENNYLFSVLSSQFQYTLSSVFFPHTSNILFKWIFTRKGKTKFCRPLLCCCAERDEDESPCAGLHAHGRALSFINPLGGVR